MCSAGQTQEGKPEQHGRTESLADFTGARMLHGKQRGNDCQRDDDNLQLSATQEPVHALNAAQAFHRSCHGDRRRQNAVGQERRTAQHGRNNQPLPAGLDQCVQREDAAFPVVVRLHGNQHILYRGQERDRPDHQRQRTDDEMLIHTGNTAVALHDRFHHVQRGSSDVAVDNADGYQEHGEAESFLFILLFSYSHTHIRHSVFSSTRIIRYPMPTWV